MKNYYLLQCDKCLEPIEPLKVLEYRPKPVLCEFCKPVRIVHKKQETKWYLKLQWSTG